MTLRDPDDDGPLCLKTTTVDAVGMEGGVYRGSTRNQCEEPKRVAFVATDGDGEEV